jgi:DNA-directed RNA polymerase beta subunit
MDDLEADTEAQGKVVDLTKPVVKRDFADIDAVRNGVLDGVKNAYSSAKMENKQHRLEFADVEYNKPKAFTLKDEKDVKLRNSRLYWNLHGRMKVFDKTTGALLSEDAEPRKLAEVPYLTSTGTWIHNGVEYGTAGAQMRLRPGAYTRIQSNGDIETQFNVLKGSGFRVKMEPSTGVFKMQAHQAQMKLYPVLRALGYTDADLEKHWGREILNANKAADDKTQGVTVTKLVHKLGGFADRTATAEEAQKRLPEILDKLELDPGVMKRTLGSPYAKVSPDVILSATKKIMAVNRGEQEPDDRDALVFQSFHSPEDFFREHVEKDAGQFQRQALWKAGFKKSTEAVPDGYFTKQLRSVLLGSGLTAPLSEINPIEMFDQRHKITRMGEGGISSGDVVPEGSRGVQPTHFGFIDPIRAPESGMVALDLRAAAGTQLGSDGRMYQTVRNPKTGKSESISTDNFADSVVAFPGEMNPANPKAKVRAMVNGKVTYVEPSKVDYELQHPASMWSPTTYMIPFLSGIKGQRASMGSRMQTQALALREAEAPLVQARDPRTARGLPDLMGVHMGAVFARGEGVVKAVGPDGIDVAYPEGTHTHEIYNHHPLNQKSFLHSTAVVRPGQTVRQGDILARSNFTDAKGSAAFGKNLLTAYHVMDGLTHEDAVVISESAAKKLASEQMYTFEKERGDLVHDIGKDSYVAKYGGTFSKEQLDRIGPEGSIKPGSIVQKGDPLILAVGKKPISVKGSIVKKAGSDFTDAAELWEHDAPAEIVDVRRTPSGVIVTAKSYTPTHEADKLCYSEDTEFLTWNGWKLGSELVLDEPLASLGPCGQLEYLRPDSINVYDHSGRMYSLETTQVSLLVTENHSLYANPRNGNGRGAYGLHRADALYGKTYKLKNNADLLLPGVDPRFKALPDYVAPAGQGGLGIKKWEGGQISSKCYAFLLGAFLSEGCVLWQPDSGNYGISISQKKPEGVKALLAAFREHSLSYTMGEDGFVIYGKALALLFSEISPPGHRKVAHLKRIPQEVWGWTVELQSDLLQWLMWGDGSTGKTSMVYTTTSGGLAGDIQRLALHLGVAANVRPTAARRGVIKGKEYQFRARYDVIFYLKKNHPEINHGHHTTQGGQKEAWVQYEGKVYCPSLPRNHTLYVRRRGKAIWCGNSGLFGNKGVVSKVIPDSEMLRSADGSVIDVIMNPMGVASRVNPSALAEAALGKIAKKHGKPYVVEGFPKGSIRAFAIAELAKHGMSDTETITDPKTGRKIPGVFVGVPYLMKLHHLAEGKESARSTGAYTSEGRPARGSYEGSKRLGFMELSALLSHGVPNFLEDAKLVRGQRNDEYWQMYRLGHTPPPPKISLAHEKFENSLRAAGVHLRKESTRTQLVPATKQEIETLAGSREITVPDTVDFDTGDPVPGGLFDVGVTGGRDGTHWGHVKLTSPIPSPLMEDPLRSILGLTKKAYRDVLAGNQELNGHKGPHALQEALGAVEIPREIASTMEAIKSGKKSTRDADVKKLGYLKAMERMGIHPKDLILDKVPVIPPKYRPISKFEDMVLSADMNYLYKDLMEANKNVALHKEAFGTEGDPRLQLYDALKAVQGIGAPITQENQDRAVRGALKQIVGTAPKHGAYQRKVIGSALDFTGRGVITPDVHLDIDEVGLPLEMSWNIFKPFVVRRLARSGMQAKDALEAWKKRSPRAAEALEKELQERPVVLNRAPSLHKYNMTGHFARPMAGHAIRVSNLILKGHAGDYDGDALTIHVPVGDKAVRDVKEKMMPSKMLLHAGTFDVHMVPPQGFVTGLYLGTKSSGKEPRKFATKADMIRAYRSGELDADDPVIILQAS